MHDDIDEKKTLSKYRIERSVEDLKAARVLLETGDLRASNNRAYYAMFHAVRAVLALDGFDSKKHSGIISEFRKTYIKTAIFAPEISDMIGDAFIIRNSSDYDDMFIAEKSQTEQQISNAEKVVNTIKEYLSNQDVL